MSNIKGQGNLVGLVMTSSTEVDNLASKSAG